MDFANCLILSLGLEPDKLLLCGMGVFLKDFWSAGDCQVIFGGDGGFLHAGFEIGRMTKGIKVFCVCCVFFLKEG